MCWAQPVFFSQVVSLIDRSCVAVDAECVLIVHIVGHEHLSVVLRLGGRRGLEESKQNRVGFQRRGGVQVGRLEVDLGAHLRKHSLDLVEFLAARVIGAALRVRYGAAASAWPVAIVKCFMDWRVWMIDVERLRRVDNKARSSSQS